MNNSSAFPCPPLRVRCTGSTLAATMLVVAAIVSFLSISALVTSQFGRYAGRQAGDADLQTAADAALEYAYAQWHAATSIIVNTRSPITSDLSALNTALATNINGTSLPFNAAGITFSNFGIYVATQNGSPVDDNTDPTGTPTSNVLGYPGWTGTTNNYVATVTVSSPSHYGFMAGSTPTLTVRRYFQVTQVPLFQAAIFYENKLEIHPGAAMTVSGLVHTNADLWARGFSTLQFKSNVSYVTQYNEIGDATVTKGWDGSGGGYIPGVGPFAGVPQVTWSDNKTSATTSAKATQLNQVSPIDPFADTPTGSNGLHDLVEVPTPGTPAAANQQVAYNQATLVITIDSSLLANDPHRVLVTDNKGNALDAGNSAASAADTAAIKAAVGNGAATTIYDQREASNVTLTNLDMTKLAAATVAPNPLSGTPFQKAFNGVVYIHDVSKSASSQPAIRLINGANLGQDVTIASDNGVYIQGDYNTGVATASNPIASNSSNSDGTANPQITGYTRFASAVMADAVTILSDNWKDSNANQALSSRVATPTTVNTAILAGDVPSNLNNNGIASGGAHNFPRFLENWNAVNFTYWGSLVEAYRSEEFTGKWQTGNVYYWPNRMWNFDTNFVGHHPPGTASGIQYTRGRWERD